MQSECIIAEFEDSQTANLGLEVLAKAGYGTEHVSIITRQGHPALQNESELETSSPDSKGVASGAGVGSVLGGALAVPLAASTLLGPFLLVGPLVGIGVGAMLGAMLGSSADKKDAKAHFRETVEQGGVLIIVAGSNAELLDAKASVMTAGPTRVTRMVLPLDAEKSPANNV